MTDQPTERPPAQVAGASVTPPAESRDTLRDSSRRQPVGGLSLGMDGLGEPPGKVDMDTDALGYIALHRKLQEHDFWKERREYSKAEAWIDILFGAAWKDHKVTQGMHIVTIPRGCQLVSLRHLAGKWGWTKDKVKRYLDMLVDDGMAAFVACDGDVHAGPSNWRQLRVCNYDTYQARRDSNATVTRQCRDSNATQQKKGKKGENQLSGDDAPIPLMLQAPDFLAIWEKWKAHRKRKKMALTYEVAEAQLNKLSPLGATEAVRWVNAALAGDWQGFYPPKDAAPAGQPAAPEPPRRRMSNA